MRLAGLVGSKDCPVRFRAAGYYHPHLEGIGEGARQSILRYADLICQGRFCWFGKGPVPLGLPPQWQLDFVSGKEWPPLPSERLQVVRHDGSDVKVPWELSRLQFLPVLGKGWRLRRDEGYRTTAKSLLSDWMQQNPVGIGVNWTVAMEASLRAISVCFLLELLAPFGPAEQAWLEDVTRCLWEHLLFIEAHNEFSHFARSNHYLSNIVGMFCLSSYLIGPGMDARRIRYSQLVEREIKHQVYEDGGDHEASIGYHVLVCQMFTVYAMLAGARGMEPSAAFFRRLRGMYEFMAAVADADGRLPQVGDCDDGRVELLSDDLQQLVNGGPENQNSLTVPGLLGVGRRLSAGNFGGHDEDAGWFGPAGPIEMAQPCSVRVFPASGVAIGRQADTEVLFFAMPNGIGGKGSHTHNDKLSVVLRVRGQSILEDSGTYCYSRDAGRRNIFRETLAHNTLRIDRQEQNQLSRERNLLFRMEDDACVSMIRAEEAENAVKFTAEHTGYARLGVTHRRSVSLENSRQAMVEDELNGVGEHFIEAVWHFPKTWEIVPSGHRGREVRCRLEGPFAMEMSFLSTVELTLQTSVCSISKVYGSAVEGGMLAVSATSPAPWRLETRICWQ